MSRLNKKSQDTSDSEFDSDDDFMVKNTKSASNFSRPTSSLSTDHKNSSYKKQVDSSDDEFDKNNFKSGSTTSIASRLKNAVKSTFMSASRTSKSSKSSKKSSKSNKKIEKSDTDTSRTRTPSTERKSVLENKSFSRPDTRLDHLSTSSDTKSLDSDRTQKNSKILTSDDTDESRSIRKSIKKVESTFKKKSSNFSSSDDSSSNSSSTSHSTSKKSSKKEAKAIKVSSSNEDDTENDSDTELDEPILKVKFEKKPPIDKLSRKQKSNLEKPANSGSDTESERHNIIARSSSHRNSRFLGKTFDLDSQSSGNEMTDVSPLPTPKNIDHDKLDMSVFYKALDHDLNQKMHDALDNYPLRSSSSKKKYSKYTYDEDDNDYGYTSHVNNSLDLDNELNTPASLKLLRNQSECRPRMYQKLANPGGYQSPYKAPKPFRVTSSALNRQREQQRIERENQLILKRLLHVKASKHVVKEEQIKDYEKNFGLSSLNYSKMSPMGFSTSSMGRSSNNTSSMSTKRSSSRMTSANNSRCSSAKSNIPNHFTTSQTSIDPNDMLRRATSASRRRPQWVDKW